MNATPKLVSGSAVLVLLISAAAVGAPHPAAQLTAACWLAVGQTAAATAADRQHQADQLLQQARRAMRQGNLQLAERYIADAEKLNVQYDPLLAPFQYTPARARRELEQYKQRGSAAPPQRTSAQSAYDRHDSSGSDRPPPADPFTARQMNQSADQRPQRASHKAGGLLLEARRALAHGDIGAATGLVARFRSAGLRGNPLGDSAERVEALIRQAKSFPFRDGQPVPRTAATDYARFLVEQADWLIQYGQDDVAEQLLRRAQSLPATYGPFQRTPAQLLAQIHQRQHPAEQASQGPRPSSSQLVANRRGKAEALRLVALAQQALDRGDLQAARDYVRQAVELKVPDSAFGPDETRPWELVLRIDQQMRRRAAARQAVYQPESDRSRTMQAAGAQPAPSSIEPDGQAQDSAPAAYQLFQAGLRALEHQDRTAALDHFRQAWQQRDQLDPPTRQLLQEKLDLLQASSRQPLPFPPRSSPLDEAVDQQHAAVQKLQQEVFRERAAAEQMKTSDPRGALKRLRDLRAHVAQAQIDPAVQKHLLTIVDRSVLDMQRYIEQNLAQIENDEQNKARLEEVQGRRQRRVEIDNKLAELVDNFNQLIDENRFAEAEVIARQARELDPTNPVVQNLIWKSKFARRLEAQMAVRDDKEQNFWAAMQSVDEASIPFDDRVALQYGDATRWRELSESRMSRLRSQRSRLSPEEIKLQQALSTEKVSVRFENRPLSEVMDVLGASTGVNIHLDPRGLHAEGVTSDTPVTLNLSHEISLKSALNLILEPLGLSYVIQNEVIKVTSKQLRDEDVFPRTYYVADLVIPIPNFVPSYNMGLPGAIAHAQNSLPYGGSLPASGTVPLTVAMNSDVTNPVTTNPKVLANLGPNGLVGSARRPQPSGYGPGGLGGGVVADFDSLIDLITTTVAPESWDEVGGPGTISQFEGNLSLVISQTQEVHEQIAELLQQLRRLQDLQVTIEVRFVTLQDNFFERIGVDFDFEIRDKTVVPPGAVDVPQNETFIIGNTSPNGTPTADLDIPFSQDSFLSAVPQFGGFDAATAANFGFAILSDIEAFFLLQASQGDNRSNVMQAPKVTLFNGQIATISDINQRPFVTSVIPVVGDFAAAHQPVIVVLAEGSSLTMQAVVSSDRRFVRLTLVPFFSSIGDVQEFTFSGKKQLNIAGLDAAGNPILAAGPDVIEGTTVQLPQFAFTSVSTTVNVPDGGTVLLGGIKRLSEGRTERGIPLMSKIPYVSRLFKNVGIGREASSLMFMVTPRIIIQEEEELEQTGLDSSKL